MGGPSHLHSEIVLNQSTDRPAFARNKTSNTNLQTVALSALPGSCVGCYVSVTTKYDKTVVVVGLAE